VESLFIQITVVPAGIVVVSGLNLKSFISTSVFIPSPSGPVASVEEPHVCWKQPANTAIIKIRNSEAIKFFFNSRSI
jgi:hypothetical protein